MLRVFEPNIGWREALAVGRQVLSRRVSPGERVAEFEALLCKETGAKYAVFCNSGTTALMLAIRQCRRWMMAADVSTVAVPSYTFQAAANAAQLLGFSVEAWEITDRLLMRHYTSRHRRVVVLVSHNGVRFDVNLSACLIGSGCEVIHDAAQSIGMFRMDAPIEMPQAPITTLSFSGPKVVGCGQGGAVLTNYQHVADELRGLCDHGGGNWRKTRIHEGVGGNFRMSDVSAAMGVVQMKRLPELLGIRQERFRWYRRHFENMPSDGWCALIRSERAAACIANLKAAGYEALQPYRPLQESLPYRYLPVDPEAVKAADEVLYLPVHYKVRRRDVDAICSIIKRTDPCSRPVT
jgi:perosamine synthetase